MPIVLILWGCVTHHSSVGNRELDEHFITKNIKGSKSITEILKKEIEEGGQGGGGTKIHLNTYL